MKPRLLEGIAFVPVPDGYIAEGSGRREVFTGRVAELLFGPLLPLLDGNLGTDEIADLLGVRASLIDGVVHLLAERGLVCTLPSTDDPYVVFLRRTLGAEHGEAVRMKLSGTRVAVVGRGELAGLVRRLLRRSGVTVTSERVDIAVAVGPDREPLGVVAGTIAGGILRRCGEFDGQVSRNASVQGESAKYYLTEPRERNPLCRSLVRLLAGAIGPGSMVGFPGGIHAYLVRPGRSVHFCDIRTGELVRLRGVPLERAAGLLVVLTGDLARTHQTFGEDASRFLTHDTDLVVAELAARAPTAGWNLVVRGDCPPDLSGQLELDHQREIVMACLAVDEPQASAVRQKNHQDGASLCGHAASLAGCQTC